MFEVPASFGLCRGRFGVDLPYLAIKRGDLSIYSGERDSVSGWRSETGGGFEECGEFGLE